MEEWSKLTTVNFPHGMGGNFFSCLLTNTTVKLSQGLTVDYNTPGISNKIGFKTLDIHVGSMIHDEYKKHWLEEDTDDEFTQRQRKFHKLVGGSTFEEFKNNLIIIYRDLMKHNINVKTVWSPHHTYGNQKYLSCQEVFPGSRNICLLVELDENLPVYDFIFRSKAVGYWDHERIYQFFRHKKLQSGVGEIVYYLDRILFERGFKYINQIEDELKVKINLEDVSMYRKAHLEFLKKNGVEYSVNEFEWDVG